LDYNYGTGRTKQPSISEKPLPKGGLTLRVEKYYDPDGQLLCYLVGQRGQKLDIGVGSWADIDQQGRLVFASKGRLYSGTLKKGQVVLNELADFNNVNPSPLKAPKWAQSW
ncbi:MAG TPA: hypothetical protein VK466_03390, partial [Terriglobales bacterium]|nr:hypothetical protein [Terriglobales bacterium]